MKNKNNNYIDLLKKGGNIMAIYHCHCKIISRGQGRSAVGAAAYRSGEKIKNDYDGLTHDYTKRGGVVYSEIMLCDNAPREYKNRSVLWNEVERIEKGSRSQLAREYEIALPIELNKDKNIKLVRSFVEENFIKAGMCADIAIHDKDDGNPHAHIMLTVRPIEQDGSWGTKQKKEYILDKNGNKQYDKKKQTYKCKTIKTTDWDTKEFLERTRASWAEFINHELERKNISQRVDHRSFEEQGKEQIPTQHLGVAAHSIKKKGGISERSEINEEIKQINSELQKNLLMQERTKLEIIFIKEDIKWLKLDEQVNEEISIVSENKISRDKLIKMQENANKLYLSVENMQPTEHIATRKTIVNSKEVSYFDYNKNRLINLIMELQSKIKQQIEFIGYTENKTQEIEKLNTEYEQKQVKQTAFDVETIAKQLEEYKSAFIIATFQKGERTDYQENTIYKQQAKQIVHLVDVVKEQIQNIEQLTKKKDSLGLLKFKEKKSLQAKIDSYIQLLNENKNKLELLGVSDLSEANMVIGYKNRLAENEKEKVRLSRANIGAEERADEAKKQFLSLAKQVPDENKREVINLMKKYEVEHGRYISIKFIQAEMIAKRELMTVMQPPKPQRQRKIDKSRDWER